MKNDLLLILKMRCVNKNVKNQYIYILIQLTLIQE